MNEQKKDKDRKETKKEINDECSELLSNLEWWNLRTKIGKQYEITIAKDIGIYEDCILKLHNNRIRITSEISVLEKELLVAKTEMNHCQEYDDMMSIIDQKPDRKQTAVKLNEMKVELKKINQSLNLFDNEIEIKSKQCYTAFAAIQALENSFGIHENDDRNAEIVDDDMDVNMNDA